LYYLLHSPSLHPSYSYPLLKKALSTDSIPVKKTVLSYLYSSDPLPSSLFLNGLLESIDSANLFAVTGLGVFKSIFGEMTRNYISKITLEYMKNEEDSRGHAWTDFFIKVSEMSCTCALVYILQGVLDTVSSSSKGITNTEMKMKRYGKDLLNAVTSILEGKAANSSSVNSRILIRRLILEIWCQLIDLKQVQLMDLSQSLSILLTNHSSEMGYSCYERIGNWITTNSSEFPLQFTDLLKEYYTKEDKTKNDEISSLNMKSNRIANIFSSLLISKSDSSQKILDSSARFWDELIQMNTRKYSTSGLASMVLLENILDKINDIIIQNQGIFESSSSNNSRTTGGIFKQFETLLKDRLSSIFSYISNYLAQDSLIQNWEIVQLYLNVLNNIITFYSNLSSFNDSIIHQLSAYNEQFQSLIESKFSLIHNEGTDGCQQFIATSLFEIHLRLLMTSKIVIPISKTSLDRVMYPVSKLIFPKELRKELLIQYEPKKWKAIKSLLIYILNVR